MFRRLTRRTQYAAAHSFLFIIAQCFSKLSTALLTKRLFQNGRNANFYVCWGLLGVSIFYGLWSILALAAACANPASPIPISSHEQCHGRVSLGKHEGKLDVHVLTDNRSCVGSLSPHWTSQRRPYYRLCPLCSSWACKSSEVHRCS